MSWSTPKTDWNGETVDGVYTGDRFNAVDFNRIKNNLEYLRELAIKMYDEFAIQSVGCEKTVKDYCISLLSDADLSSYIRLTGREEISELIREVKLQEMRELFPTGHPVSDYTTKMTHTIDLLQRLSSAL